MLRVVWHRCLMGQFPCFAWLLLLCTVTRQMQNYVVWRCVCVCMKLKNYICVYSQFSSLPAYFRTIVTFWVDRWMANCVCGTFPTRRLRCGTRWAGPPSWSLRPISASTDALLSLGRTMDDAFSTIRTWVPWVDFLVTVSYETHTRLTALCLGLPGWAGTRKVKTNLDFTEARDSEWQWHQLNHMQVCTSLQTDNHTSTPPLSFLQAGCPSCRPTNSIKALKDETQIKLMCFRGKVTGVIKFLFFLKLLSCFLCLQCFHGVGWATGRASSL